MAQLPNHTLSTPYPDAHAAPTTATGATATGASDAEHRVATVLQLTRSQCATAGGDGLGGSQVPARPVSAAGQACH